MPRIIAALILALMAAGCSTTSPSANTAKTNAEAEDTIAAGAADAQISGTVGR